MRGLGDAYKQAKASDGEFKRLPSGGYVCRITRVENIEEEKPYLLIVYDIAEGEYKGFYTDVKEKVHQNRHYYTTAAMGMFKGFLKALDESNGTNFYETAINGFDERKMTGLLIGYVIVQEEYDTNDGEKDFWPKVRTTKSVQAIRDGRFTVPEQPSRPEPVISSRPDPEEDDLPF